MASIFTYDPDPPRVSSPWSTSGSSTPQPTGPGFTRGEATRIRADGRLESGDSYQLADYGITKLEPEPQEGPTEYKLHLLLRPRRLYTAMTTGHIVGGSYHARSSLSPSAPVQVSNPEAAPRSPQAPSAYSRQQRLQQLTTQLLWRLQQSSPFHSSSTANLVLPVLPEATPRLGATQKPARLLPGLEESQGALYEIGVADDGTFVGLTEDELEESLDNLRAMAASLGCKVEVLRKVVVGSCEWTEEADSAKTRSERLWVAEALVIPDLEYYSFQSLSDQGLKQLSLDGAPIDAEDTPVESGCSRTEQIRISITGPSTAGKSSLLGTLTTSALDNGRGKSRLSLLKHRHEISSGITSSVAQELIGYRPTSSTADTADVINYASGNVAAWNDIHAASDGGRLAFVSDLPGLTRYLKSTLRGLMSWAPHYIILCIPANCCGDTTTPGVGDQAPDIDLCLAYLELCIKLEVPILLTITKLDLASRTSLKQTLTRVLSSIKTAGRRPLMLSVATDTADNPPDLQKISATDCQEAIKTINAVNGDWVNTIPILMTSAVNGSGIGKLHAFLRFLPIARTPPSRSVHLSGGSRQPIPVDVFDIDEVFAIPPSKVYSSAEETRQENKGVVLCGLVRHGSISIGDELVVGPIAIDPPAEDGSSHPSFRSRTDNFLSSSPGPRSFRSRLSSGDFSTSFSQGSFPGKSRFSGHAECQRVRVVSVRNLRLSVRTLMEDQVGTIGIEPIASGAGKEAPGLGRLRKGMVLAQVRLPQEKQATVIPRSLSFSTGFVATFPAHDFASPQSPPLILGGNAVIYVGNIRTTAKVICVALADEDVASSPPSPTEPDFFSFDGEDKESPNHSVPRRNRHESDKMIDVSSASGHENINITFAFISSVEWIEVGSLVAVMPGAATTTSASGEPVVLSGLEGFVGRIYDVIGSEEAPEK
jgi:GTPase